MSIERKLIGTTDAATSSAVYVEDVFSTWLYTGNGSSQTITNGIDLATKGGLVWFKRRDAVGNNTLTDTINNGRLLSDATNALNTSALVSSFNTDGFSLNTASTPNQSAAAFASWTFRKQAKFFDIVTYTGTGSARTISHALGSVPGMIIVKRTDAASNWQVYHRSLTSAANSIQLNLNNAQASATTVWNSTVPTSSVFSVGTDATVNASGGTYVAYLFADSNSGGFGPAGTDSVVACGSLSGSSSTEVTLGWEPQYILFKNASDGGSWYVADIMRGASNTRSYLLQTNTSDAEFDLGGAGVIPTATGFTFKGANFGYTSGQNIIYLAIRRGPMRTPTDATKVFAPLTYTGNATAGTLRTSNFVTDMVWSQNRNADAFAVDYDRLRGAAKRLSQSYTATEASETGTTIGVLGFDTNVGYIAGQDQDAGGINVNGWNYVNWIFRRAPGFFDVVCYTGTGSATTVAHNLGVAPELIIVKARNQNDVWYTYHSGIGNTKRVFVNGTNAEATYSGWNNTSPTASVFSVNGTVNEVATYVAYLFASCPGVSKVGSYTGNGSSQTIDCGFASGARFVLIKRTDSTGDWYVWDSSRGIVSGNDPRLSLNTTAAEVTTDDSIDPASSGFIVNQLSATNINVSSATYIYLAIA